GGQPSAFSAKPVHVTRALVLLVSSTNLYVLMRPSSSNRTTRPATVGLVAVAGIESPFSRSRCFHGPTLKHIRINVVDRTATLPRAAGDAVSVRKSNHENTKVGKHGKKQREKPVPATQPASCLPPCALFRIFVIS